MIDPPCVAVNRVAALETDLGLRQPTPSQQLAELRDAGVVRAERQSRNMIYSLADKERHRLVGALLRGFGGESVAPPSAPRPAARPQHRVAVFARVATG